ncbi:hypothetical protein [Algoriphagus terrigena]|uniref:hypothetical protein n=1 Tax=Algoriphagus terrigena TaxID=344884 RepID=UPI0012F9F01A|nr:hypothetical protein [Algoriphagus terrigena]
MKTTTFAAHLKFFFIYLTISFLATSCCLFGNCEDEEIRGCTNPTSPNFNNLANVDDGSCISCSPTQATYINSVNTVLSNGAPVANFRFTHDYSAYHFQCSQTNGGPITATITSSAPVALRFDYLIQGLGATGLNAWSYQGSIIRIAPGEAIFVSQVAQTPVRVDVGVRILLSNVIQVP